MELCENTNRLKVSLCVRILILAAVLETSIMSSNKASLRALLSRTSLKPSSRSVKRSNSRLSHSAASRVPAI